MIILQMLPGYPNNQFRVAISASAQSDDQLDVNLSSTLYPMPKTESLENEVIGMLNISLAIRDRACPKLGSFSFHQERTSIFFWQLTLGSFKYTFRLDLHESYSFSLHSISNSCFEINICHETGQVYNMKSSITAKLLVHTEYLP